MLSDSLLIFICLIGNSSPSKKKKDLSIDEMDEIFFNSHNGWLSYLIHSKHNSLSWPPSNDVLTKKAINFMKSVLVNMQNLEYHLGDIRNNNGNYYI